MDSSKKPANDIRVRFNTRISGIINYCQRLIKENNLRELTFSAVGGSIGTLVTAVEVLKSLYPGLHQVNRLATISYQSVEEGKKNEIENLRLYPKLEVKLSLDKGNLISNEWNDNNKLVSNLNKNKIKLKNT